MAQDVSILYQGGSGGFALFYYLLLSNQFYTGLPSRNWQEMIDIQFNPKLKINPTHWKANEFWPDNDVCKNQTNKPKLYLICNPCWAPDVTQKNLSVSENTTKYMLWTDIQTQIRLSWHKRAYWFTEISKQRFSAPSNEKHYIKQILRSAVHNKDPFVDVVIRRFRPSHIIKLQDFLQNRIIPGMPIPNPQQHAFVDRWLDLQPAKAIKHLLPK